MENQTEQAIESQQEQPESLDPIHTDAEAALITEVEGLKNQIAQLREENRKLFLRLGGDVPSSPVKSADDEMRELIEKFVADGYNPNVLIGGAV